MPFTLFLIAGHVGSQDYENLTLASWEQIQEMVDSGLATIGSHTYDMHRLENDVPVFYNSAQKCEFLRDLIKSKRTIESKLSGVKVRDFAYPFGEGDPELVPLLKKAGFRTACILAPRVIDAENDPYWLNRILVNHEVFKDIVEPWLKKNSANPRRERCKKVL